MSLVNLAAVCSHLQNASKARLGLTSIPVSKLHVALMLGLQKQGFISSVTLGGPAPPKPVLLQKPPKYRGTPEEREAKNLAEQLREARKLERRQKKGYLLNARQLEKVAWGRAPEWSYKEIVPANPGQRRLWVGLKYWKNEPVLNKMNLVSKPTRRIWVNSDDLAKITRGRESAFVKGLTRTGECMFVTTDKGIMEARECVERKLGGMVLCRVI
ncbi:ribosomal protein S8 [Mytilinidion resinicola]|uniref:Ribosomal protein S8 n=1 Tax=Mytilinidion resinicola TaxID=574789 RepID=A0A6A6Z3L8_9PEZI|nr:ribosomal protein S8 [Mytilinidion resinicola]KAF2814847.1 ribosomal protein S8 [Mytilinidion resinicola]